MNNLQTLLNRFVIDPENDYNNLWLAKHYHSIGQTASAISYYIRTAERTEDQTLMYACLLTTSDCFHSQGCRNDSVKGLLQSAIALCPKRPEGYFLLSRFYERVQNWYDSYLISSIGIVVSDFDCEPLPLIVDYPGKYGVLFEKAISSWHCGLCDESRDLLIDLKENYDLDEIHTEAVDKNIAIIHPKYYNGPSLVSEVLKSNGSFTPVQLESKKNSIFLSPSILMNYDNKILLNLRNFDQINRTTCNHLGILNSDFQIEEKLIVDTSKLDVLPLCEYSGLDDARLVKWDDKLYLCGNDRDTNKNDSEFQDHEKQYISEYGIRRIYLSEVQIVNGAICEVSRYCMPPPEGVASYCEKNWMPILDMPYHFVRWTNPTQIVKYDIEKNITTVVHEKQQNTQSTNLRGSSQVISWKDGYLAVVHETHFKEDSPFAYKYGHRFIYWNKDWNLVKVSNEFVFFNNGVEYCGGLIYQDNQFLLSIAINECENFIIKCPSSVIEKMMKFNFKIVTEDETPKEFTSSTHSKSTSWIVDNFYDTPDAVREFALQQEYVEGGFGRGFIGRRTEQQFLFPNLKERFESIMSRPITKWEEYGMNGRFQIAWSGEPLVYHCDNQQWGGMLYLTPNAPYQCGTTLYAHKQTRARTYYEEGWDASWKDIPGDPHLDGTPWEPVDVLGNVYNRLVIFDASAIHSASQYFGTVKENARLWQMFFFDA